MAFLEKTKSSLDILFEAVIILVKKPILMLPIILSWIGYAFITVYFKYYFVWNNYSKPEIILIAFGITFLFCFLFSLSSLLMLEFIQQIETGEKTSIIGAIKEVLEKDVIKALPIMLVWAIIWFILTVIEAILNPKNKNNEKITHENIAKTLSNYKEFSLSHLTIDLLNAGVRLVVFMIYPAIAWEDESPKNAVKKAFACIKNNTIEFATGFITIETAAAIIFVPTAIMFKLSDEMNYVFSNTTWTCLIIYIAFATSLYLYMQQMFAALLYMWNMNWLNNVKHIIGTDNPIPTLRDIKKPDLLDKIHDLNL